MSAHSEELGNGETAACAESHAPVAGKFFLALMNALRVEEFYLSPQEQAEAARFVAAFALMQGPISLEGQKAFLARLKPYLKPLLAKSDSNGVRFEVAFANAVQAALPSVPTRHYDRWRAPRAAIKGLTAALAVVGVLWLFAPQRPSTDGGDLPGHYGEEAAPPTKKPVFPAGPKAAEENERKTPPMGGHSPAADDKTRAPPRFRDGASPRSPRAPLEDWKPPLGYEALELPANTITFSMLRWAIVLAFVGAVVGLLTLIASSSKRKRLYLRRLIDSDRCDAIEQITVTSESAATIGELRGQLSAAARSLLQRPHMEAAELNAEATVIASAANLGRFTPVFGPRRSSVDTLFLVSFDGPFDQQGERMNWLVKEVQKAVGQVGVVDCRYIESSGNRIFSAPGEPRIQLADIAAQFSAHRLVVLGTGDVFLAPETLDPCEWTQALGNWRTRLLATPVPPEKWGGREARLSPLFNHSLYWATAEGVKELADDLFTGRSCGEVSFGPKYHSWREDAFLWTIQLPPDEALAWHELCRELELLLDAQGLEWLKVLAVYPSLRWDITLYLGFRLLDDDGRPLFTEDRSARLCLLPWFKLGFMPDWVRRQLISSVSRQRRRQVVNLIGELFVSAPPDGCAEGCGSLSFVQLPVAVVLPNEKENVGVAGPAASPRLEATVPAGDTVLLDVLETVDITAFEAPRHLQKSFTNVARRGIRRIGWRLGLISLLDLAKSVTLVVLLGGAAWLLPKLWEAEEQWAKSQQSLGDAYVSSVEGERAKNLERGVAAYEAALRVFTPEAYPREHLRTGSILGEALLEMQQWSRATVALASARKAFVILSARPLDEKEAQGVLRMAGLLYSNSAYAAVETGEIERALAILDEGSAGILNLALGPDAMLGLGAQRMGARDAQGILTRVANSDLQDGALVAPILTRVGAKLLVVVTGKDGPRLRSLDLGVSVMKLPRVGLGKVDLGDELWGLVGRPLDEVLVVEGVQPGKPVFILSQNALGLLPLGVARDPSAGHRLGEKYEISYVPNLEALRHDRASTSSPPALAALIEPKNSMRFAALESTWVANHFAEQSRVVVTATPSSDEVALMALKGKNYWHFATSGTFYGDSVKQSSLSSVFVYPVTIGALLNARDSAKPRLVVLSAQQLGPYDINRTRVSETVTLPSVFTAFGAKGVLSTLWQGDGRANALLMAKFYDLHLGDGLSPAKALKRAQEWLKGASVRDLTTFASGIAKGSSDAEAVREMVASLEFNPTNVVKQTDLISPTFDEELEDDSEDFSYQPFPLAPLMTDASVASITFDDEPRAPTPATMFAEANEMLAVGFEQGYQYANLYWASRFAGAAVHNVLNKRALNSAMARTVLSNPVPIVAGPQPSQSVRQSESGAGTSSSGSWSSIFSAPSVSYGFNPGTERGEVSQEEHAPHGLKNAPVVVTPRAEPASLQPATIPPAPGDDGRSPEGARGAAPFANPYYWAGFVFTGR